MTALHLPTQCSFHTFLDNTRKLEHCQNYLREKRVSKTVWAQGRCWLNHCSYSKQTTLFSDQSWILLLTVNYCAFSLDKITMSLRKTPLIAQWMAGRTAECYCLSVTWGESLQFYVSSGRVRWLLLLQQMWGYRGIEWKICMLFFRVKWHCKEISHFCCGCLRLHLHPLEMTFTHFALTGSSGGCFEMWGNSKVKDMNHSVVHIQNLRHTV